jgi:hypothetical protein
VPAVTPLNLTVGEAVDSVVFQRMNIFLVIACAICIVLGFGAMLSTILYYQLGSLIPCLFFLACAVALGWLTVNRRAEFDKGQHEFRIVCQRLLFAPCRRRAVRLSMPFSQLPEPYMEVGAQTGAFPPGSALCMIFLDVPTSKRGGRLLLMAQHLHSHADQFVAIEIWRNYIGRLRMSTGV